jgi:hypothetical protein
MALALCILGSWASPSTLLQHAHLPGSDLLLARPQTCSVLERDRLARPALVVSAGVSLDWKRLDGPSALPRGPLTSVKFLWCSYTFLSTYIFSFMSSLSFGLGYSTGDIRVL